MELCQNLQKQHDVNSSKVNQLSSQNYILETGYKNQLELYKLSTSESAQLRSQLIDNQKILSVLQEKEKQLNEDVKKLATENDELRSDSKMYQLHKIMVAESEKLKSDLFLHQQRVAELK